MAGRYLVPVWPAPPLIRAFSTLRAPGTSAPPYHEFNLAEHVGDRPESVSANRDQLYHDLGLRNLPAWLDQEHGTVVVEAQPESRPTADASYTRRPWIPCAVMTADCLPVLFTARDGSMVAAAHAGWRGLQGGILEATLDHFPDRDLLIWLGPAIGPTAFEVGPEVREAFLHRLEASEDCFCKSGKDRYHADLYQLARLALTQAGIATTSIFGGDRCTFEEASEFFSYRRDRTTGRMATLIWREESPTA